MTTTFDAIRDRQIELIQSLLPERLSAEGFRVAQDAGDFEEWAESTAAGCFRRFTIRDLFTYEIVTSDSDVELVRTAAQVLIAYPKTWAKYGPANVRDAMDLARQDMHQIDQAIGPCAYGSYVAGQHGATEPDFTVEVGGPVIFSRLTYQIEFTRSRT